MERRAFLAAAGTAFATSLTPDIAFALNQSEAVFASAATFSGGKHGIVLLDERGVEFHRLALPRRGHDIVLRPGSTEAIAFARRPGTFALRFDTANRLTPLTFHTPVDRHFYGHGCFDPTGRLLFATENDFGNAQGTLGIYDASDGYRRIGAFATLGIGPHDVLMSGDGRRIIVANGGIETHPDSGRVKLNLATMEPAIVVLDADDGALLSRHTLPPHLHRLSLRHIAAGIDRLWIAGQFEGDGAAPAILASLHETHGLEVVELPSDAVTALAGHVGSIACKRGTNRILLTAPRGSAAVLHDADTGQTTLIGGQMTNGAAFDTGPVITSSQGWLETQDGRSQPSAVRFDNHLRKL